MSLARFDRAIARYEVDEIDDRALHYVSLRLFDGDGSKKRPLRRGRVHAVSWFGTSTPGVAAARGFAASRTVEVGAALPGVVRISASDRPLVWYVARSGVAAGSTTSRDCDSRSNSRSGNQG